MKKQLLFTVLLSSFLGFSQASLVADICVSGDSNPSLFTESNGILFFQASNINAGGNIELWKTDGTNTSMVKDLRVGGSSIPSSFFSYNGELFFSASSSASTLNLYKTDGTDSGTVLFQTSNVTIYPYFTELNNELYYARHYAPGLRGLFKYNGSSELQLSAGAPVVRYLAAFNSANKIIFQSDGANSTDWEIWQSDGTITGTNQLADIYTGTAIGSDAKDFFEFNGKIYFVAITNTTGRELFISDGTTTGTTLLKDINPGLSNSSPGNFTIFNNKLYFTAGEASTGNELWVTDGTPAGTVMVTDLYPGTTGSIPTDLIVYNNALFFAATHPSLGREIFKCTTSNTITNLKNINSGSGDSSPSDMIIYNNELFFVADDGVNGRELWHSTGFSSTTNLIANIASGSGSSNPDNLYVYNNAIYFSANDGSTGLELWKYQDPSLSVNNFELTDNEIKLYPNPAKDYFELATNVNVEKVELYNMQGQLVKCYAGQNQYSTTQLQNGMYLVKIFTDKGLVNKTLIKKD